MTVEWKEPPADARGKRVNPILEELKAHPGHWALVATASTRGAAGSQASHWRKRGCQAMSRGCEVYARWPEEETR